MFCILIPKWIWWNSFYIVSLDWVFIDSHKSNSNLPVWHFVHLSVASYRSPAVLRRESTVCIDEPRIKNREYLPGVLNDGIKLIYRWFVVLARLRSVATISSTCLYLHIVYRLLIYRLRCHYRDRQEIPSTCRRWDVNRSTCFMGNLLKSNSLCGYPMMVVYRDEEGEREKESSIKETFRIRLVTVYRLSLPRNQIKFYGIFLNDSPSIGMWSRIE